MISVKLIMNLRKVLYLTIAWIFAGLIFTIIEYLLVSPAADIANIRELTPAIHIYSYDFLRSVLSTIAAALFAGLTVGALEICYFQDRFRQKSFGFSVLAKSLIYSFTLIVLIIVGIFVDQSISANATIFGQEVFLGVKRFLSGTEVWAIILYWACIVVLTQVFLQVRDNFGYGILTNFMLGKYHTPKEEDRIFMFLDLRSSTTIAERLGHMKYHDFLHEFINDITDSIIYSRGVIYQYIGDEVTVSWTMGSSEEYAYSVQCYFDIVDVIQKKSQIYKNRYGVVPAFKAGLHCGKVTTGEIGVIKREIVFTGDVLNTTSRIQELCNTYKVGLLVSNDIINCLDVQEKYTVIEIGEIEIRGREKTVMLYNIERT